MSDHVCLGFIVDEDGMLVPCECSALTDLEAHLITNALLVLVGFDASKEGWDVFSRDPFDGGQIESEDAAGLIHSDEAAADAARAYFAKLATHLRSFSHGQA